MMDHLQDDIFKLHNNKIHVWYVNFEDYKDELCFFKNLLSDDEITKASKFRFEKDKNQSIISRAVLRLLSSKYLKINPKDRVGQKCSLVLWTNKFLLEAN